MKLKQFLLAFIPSLILSVFMLSFYPLYLRPLYQEEIIKEAKKNSITISNYFIERYLSSNNAILSTKQFDGKEKSILKDLEIFNIWKLRFFDSNGVIVYSSAKNEINSINQKPFFVQKVAKGEILSKIEKKGGETFSQDKTVPYDVVETYIPNMKGKVFNGAFEIYLNVTDQMQRLKNIFWKSYILIVVVIFTFIAMIYIFAKKIDAASIEKEKLITKLQTALSEVKTLQGIIPICSMCKKIRDDEGSWKQIEQYIHEHSDATFSHGMCSECSNELYGNEDWYIKMKNKKGEK